MIECPSGCCRSCEISGSAAVDQGSSSNADQDSLQSLQYKEPLNVFNCQLRQRYTVHLVSHVWAGACASWAMRTLDELAYSPHQYSEVSNATAGIGWSGWGWSARREWSSWGIVAVSSEHSTPGLIRGGYELVDVPWGLGAGENTNLSPSFTLTLTLSHSLPLSLPCFLSPRHRHELTFFLSLFLSLTHDAAHSLRFEPSTMNA